MTYSKYNNNTDDGSFQSERYSRQYEEKEKTFDTKFVNNDNVENGEGAYDRTEDSEVKLLEDIAHRLNMKKGTIDETMEGTIYLATDRAPCLSCSGVIDQFQKMFPNVKVVVIYKFVREEKKNK